MFFLGPSFDSVRLFSPVARVVAFVETVLWETNPEGGFGRGVPGRQLSLWIGASLAHFGLFISV